MRLFFTGFLQVFFVSINTYFISRQFYIGVVICGFMISLIWAFNVKRIVLGTTKERLVYAAGASLGGLLGLLFSVKLLSYFM
jgi:hypothetical protein